MREDCQLNYSPQEQEPLSSSCYLPYVESYPQDYSSTMKDTLEMISFQLKEGSICSDCSPLAQAIGAWTKSPDLWVSAPQACSPWAWCRWGWSNCTGLEESVHWVSFYWGAKTATLAENPLQWESSSRNCCFEDQAPSGSSDSPYAGI